MTVFLELTHLVQHYGVTQVDVGGGRIDAQLHPQGLPLLDLSGKPALRQRFDRILSQRCCPQH